MSDMKDDMNRDSAPTTFRTELLAELVTMVESGAASAEASASAAAGPGAGRNRRRIHTLVAVGLAAVAAGVLGTLVLGDSPAQAAPFTVAREADGSVRFAIHEYRDPAGLQAALRAAGVNAVVDYLEPGQRCGDGRFTPFGGTGAAPEGLVEWVEPPEGKIATDDEIAYYRQGWQEIRPALMPAGTTLVLSMSIVEDGENRASMGTTHLAVGEVRTCDPVVDGTIPRPVVTDGMPGLRVGATP